MPVQMVKGAIWLKNKPNAYGLFSQSSAKHLQDSFPNPGDLRGLRLPSADTKLQKHYPRKSCVLDQPLNNFLPQKTTAQPPMVVATANKLKPAADRFELGHACLMAAAFNNFCLA